MDYVAGNEDVEFLGALSPHASFWLLTFSLKLFLHDQDLSCKMWSLNLQPAFQILLQCAGAPVAGHLFTPREGVCQLAVGPLASRGRGIIAVL